jgi:osmotically-inducible protein OsmY
MIHSVETSSAVHDADLERRIVALLDGYHISSLRKVRVQARDRAITVSGEVNTFYAKQVLQHAVQRIGGDYQIDNQVRVSPARSVSGSERFRTQPLQAAAAPASTTPIVTSLANGLGTVQITISH